MNIKEELINFKMWEYKKRDIKYSREVATEVVEEYFREEKVEAFKSLINKLSDFDIKWEEESRYLDNLPRENKNTCPMCLSRNYVRIKKNSRCLVCGHVFKYKEFAPIILPKSGLL